MKRIFLKLSIALIVSSTLLPVTACTFNFYVNRAKNAIAQQFANQTANIVKSLVLSKNLNADTNTNIDNFFNINKNSTIDNPSHGKTINNWGDFQQYWGINGKINTSGFNQDQFLVANGKGNLTKQIINMNNLDNTFQKLSYINSFSLTDNQNLYAELIAPNALFKNIIVDFINQLKITDVSKLSPILQQIIPLIRNIASDYQGNFLTPLTNLLKTFSDGWWKGSSPINYDTCQKFMNNWKDDQDQPYSQWNFKNQWNITTDNVLTWNKQDINLYRGGVLINYLFWKISKDHKIGNLEGKDPDQPRYLGNIISNHLTDSDPQTAIINDLKQYLPNLIENPNYIFTLLEAIIPIIKQYLLKMTDISQGIKHLTIGDGYPTILNINRFNLNDIIKTIKDLLNNKEKLNQLVNDLLISPFTYDLQINYHGIIVEPLGYLLNSDITIPLIDIKAIKTQLVKTIVSFLTSESVKNIFNQIANISQQLNDQYGKSGGIDIDSDQLKEQLTNDNTGLFALLKPFMDQLKIIINKTEDINDEELLKLYTLLGGAGPTSKGIIPSRFTGFLNTLQTAIINPNNPLKKIIILLIGNDLNQKGFIQLLQDNNNHWINDHYTKYFTKENDNKMTSFSNIKMTSTTIIKDQEIINLSYQLTYNFNQQNYQFIIKCICLNDLIKQSGVKSFRFQTIQLLNTTKS